LIFFARSLSSMWITIDLWVFLLERGFPSQCKLCMTSFLILFLLQRSLMYSAFVGEKVVGTEWMITGKVDGGVTRVGSHWWVQVCLFSSSQFAANLVWAKNLISPEGSVTAPLIEMGVPSGVLASISASTWFDFFCWFGQETFEKMCATQG
jgi:hypothetical protein